MKLNKKFVTPLIPAAMLTFGMPAGASDTNSKAQSENAGAPSAWQETKASLEDIQNEASDASANAWLDGKLEATLLLNRHLNNFRIDTDVRGDTAFLGGTVRSDIDRDLAEAVALNIDGIDVVENNIKVDANAPEAEESNGSDFSQRIKDATTTAIVKSKLVAHDNIEGMALDVETHDNVVTVSGTVKSNEISSLVENVVASTDDVASVVNELRVGNNSQKS